MQKEIKKQHNNFPNSFLFGASTSSYQTEGNNYNSNWAQWEKEQQLTPLKIE